MGSTDISLGSQGRSGSPLCFALVTHTPTPVHSKFQIPNSAVPPLLFETLARSARSAGRLYTLPTAFRSGNTHTPHSPRQHAKVHPVEPVLPRLDANCNLRSKHQSPTPTSRSVPCVRIHALSVESFTPVMITSEEMKRQEAVKELHEMAGLSGTLMAVSDENEYFPWLHPPMKLGLMDALNTYEVPSDLDPDSRDESGTTPLAKCLLVSDCDDDLRDLAADRCGDVLLLRGDSVVKMFHKLLLAGADPNARSYNAQHLEKPSYTAVELLLSDDLRMRELLKMNAWFPIWNTLSRLGCWEGLRCVVYGHAPCASQNFRDDFSQKFNHADDVWCIDGFFGNDTYININDIWGMAALRVACLEKSISTIPTIVLTLEACGFPRALGGYVARLAVTAAMAEDYENKQTAL